MVMLGRRALLLSPLAAALLPRKKYAAQLAAQFASGHGEIYRQLGVRPLINAAGTYTTLTGFLLVPEARAAMNEASKAFVPLVDLQLRDRGADCEAARCTGRNDFVRRGGKYFAGCRRMHCG
jgi:hypothetical protein